MRLIGDYRPVHDVHWIGYAKMRVGNMVPDPLLYPTKHAILTRLNIFSRFFMADFVGAQLEEENEITR